MHRDKALALFDALIEIGYSTTLHGHYISDHVGDEIDPETQTNYWVAISELSLDKVDVKKLVEIADEYELDIGFSAIRGGSFSFQVRRKQPPEVVSPRRHPIRQVSKKK